MTTQPLSHYSGNLDAATAAARDKQAHDAAASEALVGEQYADQPHLAQWYGGDLDAVIAGR